MFLLFIQDDTAIWFRFRFSFLVFTDFSTSSSSALAMNSTHMSREDAHNLEQIQLVLDLFEKNTKVMADPLVTIIIILYGVLVSAAGIGEGKPANKRGKW